MRLNKFKKKIVYLLIPFLFFYSLPLFAIEVPLKVLPLDNYSEDIKQYLNPEDPNYFTPLVESSYLSERSKEFYKRYFSTEENGLSPWNQKHVTQLVNSNEQKEVQTNHSEKTPLYLSQEDNLDYYTNKKNDPKHTPYGQNFRILEDHEFDLIKNNMNLDQFNKKFQYNPAKRAILVRNEAARALPTSEPLFYHFTLPGEGYPFDNLQITALWAGTPVYILGQTKDKIWSLVETPDVRAWIKTESLAKVSKEFIKTYQGFAIKKIAAITKTKTIIQDSENKQTLFAAYVGSIFPVSQDEKTTLKLLIPVKDLQGNAHIRYSNVPKDEAGIIPIIVNRSNFAKLLSTLQGRPYGWGGLYFYNDCSAELKSLFTPFGIWLPRHSTNQTEVGKMIDKSQESVTERLRYLKENGQPLMTIVYVGKHVFLYVGTDKDQNIISYQNVWALKSKDKSRRGIIGKSLFLPLLVSYPEDKELASHADLDIFKIVFLNSF